MLQNHQQPTYNVVGQPHQVATVVYTTRPSDHLILSIFTCLLCFCPTGFLAIIYSCKSKNAADRNDFTTARKEGHMAKIFASISLSIGLTAFVCVAIYLIVVFVIFANFANNLMIG